MNNGLAATIKAKALEELDASVIDYGDLCVECWKNPSFHDCLCRECADKDRIHDEPEVEALSVDYATGEELGIEDLPESAIRQAVDLETEPPDIFRHPL